YFYDRPAANLDFGDGTSGTAHHVLGHLSFVWDTSGEEHFSYDARGRAEWTVKRLPDLPHTNLVSYRTVHEYDALDRQTRLLYPDNDEITFQYNARTLAQSIAGGPTGYLVSQMDYLPS